MSSLSLANNIDYPLTIPGGKEVIIRLTQPSSYAWLEAWAELGKSQEKCIDSHEKCLESLEKYLQSYQ